MGDTLAVIKTVMFIVTIVSIVGLLFIIIFDGKTDKMKNKLKPKDKSGNTKEMPKTKSKNVQHSGTRKERLYVKDSKDSLPFDSIEIYSPDYPIGIIAKNDKTSFVGVIEVKGINYNLLDQAERELLEKGFETMLNGIDYPIQLIVQSRIVDIESYKRSYETRLEEIKKALLKMQEKITFYEGSDGNVVNELRDKYKQLQNQYDYGNKLKTYILNRCKNQDLLDKKYYICVEHKYNSSMYKEDLTRQEILANAFFDIQNKANSIIGALARAKLSSRIQEGNELAELLYISYNKADSEHYRMEAALESRFSHLYTTAEAVELKAMKRAVKDLEKQEKELKEEISQSAPKKANSDVGGVA